MIRFSAQGVYLLLVPQGGRLFGKGRLFCFLRNNQMLKKNRLMFI